MLAQHQLTGQMGWSASEAEKVQLKLMEEDEPFWFRCHGLSSAATLRPNITFFAPLVIRIEK